MKSWRTLLTVTCLLLFAPAEARMHAPYRGHRIVPQASPLDGFATPSGAYSFRKLRSAYAGPAVRIRRASDNLETDINFLGCTGFTGCPWDEAAANAHCAATTCFVRSWYNQGAQPLADWVQTVAANQPALVFNCQNGLPCIEYTTATMALLTAGGFTPTTGVASLNVVANRSAGTGQCTMHRQNGSAGQRIIAVSAATNWQALGGTSGTITAAAANGAWHTATVVVNGAGSSLAIDGAATAGTLTGSTATAQSGTVGGAATTCRVGEAVSWDAAAIAAANIAVLTSNQQSFWGF